MGRRPIGDRAMTVAERTRRHRARKHEAWLASLSPGDRSCFVALGFVPTNVGEELVAGLMTAPTINDLIGALPDRQRRKLAAAAAEVGKAETGLEDD